MRRLLLLVPIGAGLTLAAACGDETYDYGPSQRLGDPNALFGALRADGGADSAPSACTPDRYVDGSACSVSFRTDLFAAQMVEGKPWNCAAGGCHGGATPPNKPAIDNLDASAACESLAAYAIRNTSLRYINPCATDLRASGFSCNMHFDPACGTGMPSSNHLPDADLVQLEAWIACGAPLN